MWVCLLTVGLAGSAAAERGRRVPSAESLQRRLGRINTRYPLDPDFLRRTNEGLRDGSAAAREAVHHAIRSELANQLILRRAEAYPAADYRRSSEASERHQPRRRPVKDPTPPAFTGLFVPTLWQQLAPGARARALGLVQTSSGAIQRPEATRHVPRAPPSRRELIFRKAPRYLDGLLPYLFSSAEATGLTRQLDRILRPTPQGSYRLFADRVTLLYPDNPISPAGGARYAQAVRDALNQAAFVFLQTYQFTDPASIQLVDRLARSGVPVYAVLGEGGPDHPALQAWRARGSKVNLVVSHQENQGRGREYRIDHNKNLLVVKRDGTAVVIKGGFNQNTHSAQNVDLGHMLEGGNVALDVLGPMVRDYLRAGGRLKPDDLRPLRGALQRAITARKGRGAVEVETAITSSHLVGQGPRLTPPEIDRALAPGGVEVFVSGRAVLKALTPGRGQGRSDVEVARRARAFVARAQEGQRIVITAEPDLSRSERRRLAQATRDFANAGIEVVSAGAIYVDNSTENVMHRLVQDAVTRREKIVQAAFASSDGNFAERLLQASADLAAAGRRSPVQVITADLRINNRDVNAGNRARLMFSDFHGRLLGVSNVPGPSDGRGRGRKFHAKALVSYKPAGADGPASGCYMLQSNNHSHHGMQVNEESSVTVHSPELAKQVMDFLNRAGEAYGQDLRPAFNQTQLGVTQRPSLTKRVVTPATKLKDIVFMVMDYETDGLSVQTDARPLEIAASAYVVQHGRLVPYAGTRVPGRFVRLINPGKDQFGRDKRVPGQITQITQIDDGMVRYQPGMTSTINAFNRWVRALEKQSGKTVLFVGHNFAAFDRRIHNEICKAQAIVGNPYIDGDVADTLHASRRITPDGSNTLSAAARKMGVQSTGAHRADGDVQTNAGLFEAQLTALARGLTVSYSRGKTRQLTPPLGDLGEVRWGDVRHVFIARNKLRAERRAQREATHARAAAH